jgi:hypothetical protein
MKIRLRRSSRHNETRPYLYSPRALRVLPMEAVNMVIPQQPKPKSDGPAKFITTKEGARLIGVSARTMETWREETMRARRNGSLGQDSFVGPPYVKFSARLVRYSRDDLLKWADRQGPNRGISALNTPAPTRLSAAKG